MNLGSNPNLAIFIKYNVRYIVFLVVKKNAQKKDELKQYLLYWGGIGVDRLDQAVTRYNTFIQTDVGKVTVVLITGIFIRPLEIFILYKVFETLGIL